MPRLKQRHVRDPNWRCVNNPVRDPAGKILAHGVTCVAASCPNDPVPDAPVALCGKHMREVYEFAQDYIADRWEDGVRTFVADSLPTFKPPAAMVRRPRAGYVYFIRFGHRVKVGYTEDPKRRLAALPHEEVLGVVPGTYDDEQAWHRLLADFRVTGEWYQAEPEVLERIRAVVDEAG